MTQTAQASGLLAPLDFIAMFSPTVLSVAVIAIAATSFIKAKNKADMIAGNIPSGCILEGKDA